MGKKNKIAKKPPVREVNNEKHEVPETVTPDAAENKKAAPKVQKAMPESPVKKTAAEKNTDKKPKEKASEEAAKKEKRAPGTGGVAQFFKHEIVKTALILFTITFVVAALLGLTNAVTKDRIAAAKIDKLNAMMRAAVPTADVFEKTGFDLSEIDGITEVYEAQRAGSAVGYIVQAAIAGFSGDIEVLVALSPDMTVSNVSILSHGETPGLGSKITGEAFRAQFAGVTKGVFLTKTPTGAENEIMAISGATISSRAVTESVQTAIEVVSAIYGGGALE